MAVNITHEFSDSAGAKWMLNRLAATEGLRILTQIAGIIGEGAGHVGTGISGEEIKDDSIAKAIGAIATNISKPGTVDLIKTLLGGLRKDGVVVNFDLEFAGKYKLLLLELVPWALKVNFADFLEGNAVLSAISAKMKSLTPAKAT
jgi:hypothetical protein